MFRFKPLLPEIARPIAISYSQRDFWLTYRIARALGMGKGPQKGGIGNVWFQFPHPNLIPPYEKLDYIFHVPQVAGHWGLDVIPVMIALSESLIVVLSCYSARSEQVHLEVKTYPKRKPIWIMPIAGEPVPPAWAERPNTYVVDPPIPLKLKKALKKAFSEASKAHDAGRYAEASLFYYDAINLQHLVNPRDLWRIYNLFALKGQCEVGLGLGMGAVQSFEAALNIAESMPGQEMFKKLAAEKPGKELVILGPQPACAMQAHTLRDLGAAHMIARDEPTKQVLSPYGLPVSEWGETSHDPPEPRTGIGSDARAMHLKAAQECWRKCLDILDEHSDLLTHLSRFPYEDLRQTCKDFLHRSQAEA